jgi:hypothetical protein
MSEIEKRLTLEQVKDTQEYSVLTGKQQLFVETYITSGVDTGTYDPVVASLTAYTCKSREVARIMSYSLMANIRIIAVLNRHFNREPLEEFIIQVNRAIQNKKVSQAQIWALRLKADVLGFGARLPGTNNFTPGTIPPDVKKKLDETRKAKRKKPVRAPEVEKPWEFADH